jgi:hypothetical protein
MPSTLGFGDKGPEVADLVRLLTTHGCAPAHPESQRPGFGRSVENMVLCFQMTHQNADEKWPDAG